jgi:hypothetical protein
VPSATARRSADAAALAKASREGNPLAYPKRAA